MPQNLNAIGTGKEPMPQNLNAIGTGREPMPQNLNAIGTGKELMPPNTAAECFTCQRIGFSVLFGKRLARQYKNTQGWQWHGHPRVGQ